MRWENDVPDKLAIRQCIGLHTSGLQLQTDSAALNKAYGHPSHLAFMLEQCTEPC